MSDEQISRTMYLFAVKGHDGKCYYHIIDWDASKEPGWILLESKSVSFDTSIHSDPNEIFADKDKEERAKKIALLKSQLADLESEQ